MGMARERTTFTQELVRAYDATVRVIAAAIRHH